MKNTFYIICILFLMLSCKTETKEEIDTLCNNEKFLLAPNKGLPNFNFDLNVNPKEHIEALKDSLKSNLSESSNKFNWLYKDRTVQIETIPINLMYCGLRRNTLNIQLNHNNQMLFEDELKNSDSISSLIQKNHPAEYSTKNYVEINTPFGLSNPIINDLVYNISEGFLNAMEHQSYRLYKKSICELTQVELKKLQKDNQIIIYFQSFLDQIEEDRRFQEMLNSN